MVNRTNNRVLKLTVMIALAIITVSCVAVTLGMHVIIDAEQHEVGRKAGKLSKERHKYYEQEEMMHTSSVSWINEGNKCSIVQIVGRSEKPDRTLELYINFQQTDLQKPLESITPELNRVFEQDISDMAIAFCKEHQIDYDKDAIARIDSGTFWDLISELQEETRIEP